MSYEPLHHKYRPQTFAELVGQEAIATTLTNALRQQRIAPAYLFTGARGTGKTSSARILAKSLNCIRSDVPTEQPCGVCDVCRAIANGSALDVIEIDAASNTGVDNIRELIERAQFAPVQCRYKVYVLDEVHMLTSQSFNALLKTLEEPPDRVVFVLATTDPQRVLPTIISRCQRFDFRRIPLESMVQHLSAIAANENIQITPDAVQLIAQISQGGLRDAESLLDQLSLLEGGVTVERVWDLVGAVPERDLLALVEAIAQNNPSTVLDQARHLMNRGREPLIVLQNLASFYRDLLIAKTAPDRGDLVAITPPTWKQMCEFVRALDTVVILEGQKYLRSAEVQIKNTTQPRLWLEVTLLGLLPARLNLPAAAIAPSAEPRSTITQSPLPVATSTPQVQPVQPAIARSSQNGATPPDLVASLKDLLSQVVSQQNLSPSNLSVETFAAAIATALLQDVDFRQTLGSLLTTLQPVASRTPTVAKTEPTLTEPASQPGVAVSSAQPRQQAAPIQQESAIDQSVELPQAPDPATSKPEPSHESLVTSSQGLETSVNQVNQEVAAPQAPEFAESSAPVSSASEARSLATDLETLWRQVLSQIELRGTQALLGQQCCLLAFDRKQAKVGVRSQPLFRLAQRSLPMLEEAFQKALGYPVKASLVVATEAELELVAKGELPSGAQATPPPVVPSALLNYAAPSPKNSPTGPSPVSSPQPQPVHSASPNGKGPYAATEGSQPQTVEPGEPVSAEAALEALSGQNLGWQEEDEITKAAKRLADFFGGKVVDSEDDWSATTHSPTEVASSSTWDDSETEEDDVPF